MSMLSEPQRKLLEAGKSDIRYFMARYEHVRCRFGRAEAQYCYRANQRDRATGDLAKLKRTAQWCRDRGIYSRGDFSFGPPSIQNKPPADYSGKRAKRAQAVIAMIRTQS
jgi:hypothetical protein